MYLYRWCRHTAPVKHPSYHSLRSSGQPAQSTRLSSYALRNNIHHIPSHKNLPSLVLMHAMQATNTTRCMFWNVYLPFASSSFWTLLRISCRFCSFRSSRRRRAALFLARRASVWSLHKKEENTTNFSVLHQWLAYSAPIFQYADIISRSVLLVLANSKVCFSELYWMKFHCNMVMLNYKPKQESQAKPSQFQLQQCLRDSRLLSRTSSQHSLKQIMKGQASKELQAKTRTQAAWHERSQPSSYGCTPWAHAYSWTRYPSSACTARGI